ncbi:hypothetical protein P692DRAFT_201871836 [Suillus brevipes Sb2]|nr:hypothetical protein P692DRAFT_201871836 [Suillus brevipes Sb2]
MSIESCVMTLVVDKCNVSNICAGPRKADTGDRQHCQRYFLGPCPTTIFLVLGDLDVQVPTHPPSHFIPDHHVLDIRRVASSSVLSATSRMHHYTMLLLPSSSTPCLRSLVSLPTRLTTFCSSLFVDLVVCILMSSEYPSHLHVSFAPKATSFKRTFEQFGYDSGS